MSGAVTKAAEAMRKRRQELIAQPLARIWDELAAVSIETIDAERLAERRRTCRHLDRLGSGWIKSDGASEMSWHCPDCQTSGKSTVPARPA